MQTSLLLPQSPCLVPAVHLLAAVDATFVQGKPTNNIFSNRAISPGALPPTPFSPARPPAPRTAVAVHVRAGRDVVAKAGCGCGLLGHAVQAGDRRGTMASFAMNWGPKRPPGPPPPPSCAASASRRPCFRPAFSGSASSPAASKSRTSGPHLSGSRPSPQAERRFSRPPCKEDECDKRRSSRRQAS